MKKQISQHEIDARIHGFMARKKNMVFEFKEELKYIERVKDETRGKLGRLYSHPIWELDLQY